MKVPDKTFEKITEPLAHGTHLRILSESLSMNTNMTGFRYFSIFFCILVYLDECCLSIGRFNVLSANMRIDCTILDEKSLVIAL